MNCTAARARGSLRLRVSTSATHMQGGGGGNTLSQLGRAALALNPNRDVDTIGGGGQPMDEDSMAMVRARRHQTWLCILLSTFEPV